MNDSTLTPPRSPAPQLHDAARRLSKPASRVFISLIDGLLVGDAKKLDNANGTFMAVSVDYLHGDSRRGAVYAVAHRYEVNGDLVPDPDVEFLVVDDPLHPGAKAVYPAAIDHGPLGYQRYIHFDSAGAPVRIVSRGQGDLARFCDGWMKNIAAQQGLVLS